MDLKSKLHRSFLPAVVFILTLTAHFIWQGLFSPASKWVALDSDGASVWFWRYVETQGYWMGYSYALSLAFAAAALRRYREQRFCGARHLTIAGVTFSGFLAVAGCYILGCCGSPMLVVYLNLFGTSFLPLAKPILAAITTLSVLGAWIWMARRRQEPNSSPSTKVAAEESRP